MLRIVDVSFYTNDEDDLEKLATKHIPAHLYAEQLAPDAEVEVVKHLHVASSVIHRNVKYTGLKGSNRFFHVPFSSVRYIRDFNPDVIIVQGLAFPVQVLFLRLMLGKRAIILAQHHGESAFKGIKGWVQKLASKYIDGFLFTTRGNSEAWIEAGILNSKSRSFELPEASTLFTRLDKTDSKQRLGLQGKYIFLWVARLNQGKDPMTVIEAFERMYQQHPAARLYMIFHTEELLPQIKQKLKRNDLLNHRVSLLGKKEHRELEIWFNAADFFISASKSEAMGYAVLEAIAAGCIPIVSDIPAHRKITANGIHGLLFKTADVDSLVSAFKMVPALDREAMRTNLKLHFEQQLSPKAIADQLLAICNQLHSESALHPLP